jgi:KRAB domain-containing zinc finger protein
MLTSEQRQKSAVRASPVERRRATTKRVTEYDEKYVFACDQCPKKYKGKHHLKTHVKSEHEGIKHECSECGNKFTQLNSLKTHIDGVHRGIKHECEECGMKFTELGSLKRHIKKCH